MTPLRGRSGVHPQAFLHRRFCLQALQIAGDRGNRQCTACTFVGDGTALRLETAVHDRLDPLVRVADVLDGHSELPRPEVWDRVKSFALTEDVTCGNLPLPFGNHPVFDADSLSGAR